MVTNIQELDEHLPEDLGSVDTGTGIDTEDIEDVERITEPFDPALIRVYTRPMTIDLIEKGTPDKVKFNIFKRINTGGLPLSSQEIRHALNQGEATKLLAQLADSDVFKKAVDYGIRNARVADPESGLR